MLPCDKIRRDCNAWFTREYRIWHAHPQTVFYENLTVTPALKRIFIDQIKVITWRNKIAPTTMNLAAGSQVTEVEIFEVRLNSIPLDEAVLRQMDKEIPYHIIFLLTYEGKVQAWTCYKESAATGANAFKVGTYYHTDWLTEEALPLKVDGMNIDTVYENFVRQIAGDALQPASGSSETLKDSVEREEKRKELQKKIDMMQTKVRREKQLNVQMKLNSELKQMKKELEELC